MLVSCRIERHRRPKISRTKCCMPLSFSCACAPSAVAKECFMRTTPRYMLAPPREATQAAIIQRDKSLPPVCL